ncbi:unnamed protein product [Boreogadus saida]
MQVTHDALGPHAQNSRYQTTRLQHLGAPAAWPRSLLVKTKSCGSGRPGEDSCPGLWSRRTQDRRCPPDYDLRPLQDCLLHSEPGLQLWKLSSRRGRRWCINPAPHGPAGGAVGDHPSEDNQKVLPSIG